MTSSVDSIRSSAARPERRSPCASCKQPILEGAKKCKHCKAWQPATGTRFPRAALIVTTSVVSVFSVIVTSRQSPVGEAPPLTPLPTDTAASSSEPSPAAVGPEPEARVKPAAQPPLATKGKWTTREIPMGDAHPLDVAFSPSGESVYVSSDDAKLREFRLSNGDLVHKASVQAKGDKIHLLFDRYIAVLRHDPAATKIPLLDTTHWDREATLLDVGSGPGDVEELPDGTLVTATTTAHRVSRFGLPSGRLLSDMTLPQSTGQLFLVRAEGRPYLAAMGALTFSGRQAGAWLDLFDPEEVPFGATRRSISVGGDPRAGAVTANGGAILFPDHTSNSVTLLAVERQTDAKTADVGAGPLEAFLFGGDRWGLTLNAGASTATLLSLPSMQPTTLVLPGVPRTGVMSVDRGTLFVALGGTEEPPRGQGLAIIAGDPPEVVTTLPTGSGAIAVAVSRDGSRAVVANYFAKTLTILE
jgi:DNA-binding beta-propeller fold protein YncE